MTTRQRDLLPDLLAACQRGDHAAFARLYRLTAANLFTLARRILGNDDWAQECLQDAFVQIWQRAGEYHPDKGAPITWMASIVRYRALDRLRTTRHETPVGDGLKMDLLPDPSAGPDEQARLSQDAEALRRCLGEIKEEYRRSVLLAYFEGLSHEALAQRLNAPLGTVKTWLRRGLQQLKQCLER